MLLEFLFMFAFLCMGSNVLFNFVLLPFPTQIVFKFVLKYFTSFRFTCVGASRHGQVDSNVLLAVSYLGWFFICSNRGVKKMTLHLFIFFQRHVFTRTLARCHKSSVAVCVARPLKFRAVIGLAAV